MLTFDTTKRLTLRKTNAMKKSEGARPGQQDAGCSDTLRRVLRPLCLLPCLLGCLVGLVGAPRAEAGTTRPIPPHVIQARQQLRAQDTGRALSLLQPERPLSAGEPERSWLLAHIWRERSEGSRARSAAWAMKRSSFRTALVASLDEDPAAALRDVRLALQRSRDPWLSLTAAYLHQMLGEGPEARVHAERARGRGYAFVDADALLIVARTCLEDGRLTDAAAAAAAASRIAPEDARTYLVGAAAARRDGRPGSAAAFYVEALRQVPASEPYARRLAELLRRDPDAALAARVERALATIPARANPEREALGAWLAKERGAHEEAIARYDRAVRGGANPIPAEQELRGLLARRGDYRRVVALMRAALPANVREDPRNLRRDAWRALESAVADAPDRGAPEAKRLVLARAFTALGAHDEARAVLDGAVGAAARAFAHRLASHQAFLGAFERLLEGGYQKVDREETAPGLPAMLAAMADLARRHLPADEARAFESPTRGLRTISLIGSWLDHAVDTTSPIVAYFRTYGTYLVLGRRNDHPVEAVLLSLGSLVRDQEINTRGHCFHHDVAVGFDRRLRSFATALGGDLGGACLPDGIWMDADSVRGLEHEIRLVPTRDRSWIDIVSRSPRLIRADTTDGVDAVTEGAGAGARLLLRYLERMRDDPWGSFRTLQAHEFGHLVELRRHLPVRQGLGASIRLLAESSFSLAVAEQTLEMRAQLAAVSESPDPDLALAEMLLMLPVYDRDPDPHDAGYQEAVRRMLAHVRLRPDLYPQVDRGYRLLPQLDRLTDAQIRQAARAVLPR